MCPQSKGQSKTALKMIASSCVQLALFVCVCVRLRVVMCVIHKWQLFRAPGHRRPHSQLNLASGDASDGQSSRHKTLQLEPQKRAHAHTHTQVTDEMIAFFFSWEKPFQVALCGSMALCTFELCIMLSRKVRGQEPPIKVSGRPLSQLLG